MALTSAVDIVVPADGPSFGIAPAGTWTCTSIDPRRSSGIFSVDACVAAYVIAARADSSSRRPTDRSGSAKTFPQPLTCVVSASFARCPVPYNRRNRRLDEHDVAAAGV